MSTLVASAPRGIVRSKRRRMRPARAALHIFLGTMVVVWLFPLFWAVYASLRPVGETITNGFVSWPKTLNFANYTNFWTEADLPYFYLNTLVIVVPGVVLTLLVASMVAFCCTQFSWKFNVIVLMIFTAGILDLPEHADRNARFDRHR